MLGVHSFGAEQRWCEINGMRVAETVMPAGLTLEAHAHAPGQICFILEGEYREQTGGADHTLRPGDVQIHAPGQLHANHFPPGGDVLTLLVSVDEHRWLDLARRGPIGAEPLLRELRDDIRHELRRGDDASRAALEGLALLLLSRVARSTCGVSAAEPEWLRDAVSHIERHFASPIGLVSVAAAVGVHRATLAAAFRTFRAGSVGEYIRHVRARHAIALIRRGVPLGEVAALSGFADQAHLGRVLKKITGATPGGIRGPRR